MADVAGEMEPISLEVENERRGVGPEFGVV